MDNEGNGQEIQLRNLAANKPLSLCNWKNSMVSHDERFSFLTSVAVLLVQFFQDYTSGKSFSGNQQTHCVPWVSTMSSLRDISVVFYSCTGGGALWYGSYTHFSILSVDLRGLRVFQAPSLARGYL